MTADSLSELHAFASRIGLKKSWFDSKAKRPHYDLTSAQRIVAIEMGAEAVDTRTIVRVANGLRSAAIT